MSLLTIALRDENDRTSIVYQMRRVTRGISSAEDNCQNGTALVRKNRTVATSDRAVQRVLSF